MTMRSDETGLVVFAAFTIFFYCGAFYGWGPMQLLLEENGNFHQKCHLDDEQFEQNDVVCEDQTAALLNVRMVSQLTVLLCPLLGWLVDRHGPIRLLGVMAFFTFVGIGTLTASASLPGKIDGLLYISFICLGLTATCGGLFTVQTGLVFVDTNQQRCNRVISALNAIYDAGAVTYLGLWGIAQLSDTTTMKALILGYLAGSTVCLGGYWFYYKSVLTTEPEDEEAMDPQRLGKGIPSKGDMKPLHLEMTSRTQRMPSESTFLDSTTCGLSGLEGGQLHIGDEIQPFGSHEEASNPQALPKVSESDGGMDHSSSTNGETTAAVDTYVVIAERPITQQIRSQAFVTLCLFFAFHVVSNVWTLTTARDFLKHLGDDDYGNRYLSIFTLLTPVSLLGLPFVDVAMHKYGFHAALQAVNGLAIAHGIVKVTFTDLNIQVVGFVFFSFFRCFLFSVSFSCLAGFMSKDGMGRGVGVFYVVAGLLSFVNIPLATLAVETFEGDFFVPNLIFVVLIVPVVYLTWLTGQGLKKNRECTRREKN